MNVIRCANDAHYYDADTYNECPHCLKNESIKKTESHTESNTKTEQDIKKDGAVSKILGGFLKKADVIKKDSPTISVINPKSDEPGTQSITSPEPVLDDKEESIIEESIIKPEPEKKPALEYKPELEKKPKSAPVSPARNQVTSGVAALRNDIVSAGINKDDQNTVGYFGGVSNEPVVGWLVAVSGNDKGSGFELQTGKNHIGRAANMEVVLTDKKVSRESHATIMYEPRGRKFYLLSSECKEMVYFNDDIVMENKQLANGDKILLGDTTLIFVPLCGENFTWEDYED